MAAEQQLAAVVARLQQMELERLADRTARQQAEQSLSQLQAQVAGMPTTTTMDAFATKIAEAVSKSKESDPLNSRAVVKLEKFRSDKCKWKDWHTVVVSHIRSSSAGMAGQMEVVEGTRHRGVQCHHGHRGRAG